MKTKINHLAARMLMRGWYEENECENLDKLVEASMTTKAPFTLELAALHLEYAAKDQSWYLIDYSK